jgi:hypothetical protein
MFLCTAVRGGHLSKSATNSEVQALPCLLTEHNSGVNITALSNYFDGRRNWLHVGSKEARPKIAAIFSVIGSCSKLNIPTRQYRADVLPGLAERSIQALADLIPTAYVQDWPSNLSPTGQSRQ